MRPEGQGVHSEDPAVEKVSLEQGLQKSSPTAPGSGLKVPASHGVQSADTLLFRNVPGGHIWHLPSSRKRPEGQSVLCAALRKGFHIMIAVEMNRNESEGEDIVSG
eukprot:GFKZ01001590.1.p4 GENE.GFKZ01001590.1~~GFKZ01001590.1.p4  ORF type:complete len:106 (-),score=17.23 GFKZ01001590.1:25-342(-)